MTELKKPLRRQTTLFLDQRHKARDKDRIVVSLYPDQTIGFRPVRTRREYRLPLVVCYKLAITEYAKEDRRRKAINRRVSRGLLS